MHPTKKGFNGQIQLGNPFRLFFSILDLIMHLAKLKSLRSSEGYKPV